jgi:pseudouridine-5'-phosphate glycosidase
LIISPEITRALKLSLPVVALNLRSSAPIAEPVLARDGPRFKARRRRPFYHGRQSPCLTDPDLEELARTKAIKVSRRDIAAAIIQKSDGGTTVAATIVLAHQAGIRSFATGGIGGVHREARFDISADLQALADTPAIVVCAGAKASWICRHPNI